MNGMVYNLNQRSFDGLLNNQLLTKLMTNWNSFLDHLRQENGALSAYWMSTIDLVENVILGLFA